MTMGSSRSDSESDEPTDEGESRDDSEAEPVSTDELKDLSGRELPERAVMSTIGPDVAVPLDPAIVADVLAGEPPPEDVDAKANEADDPEPEGDDDSERSPGG